MSAASQPTREPSAGARVDEGERGDRPVRFAFLEVARLSHLIGDVGEARHGLSAGADGAS